MDIEKYMQNPGICQYALVSTEQIPFSSEVVEMCRANQCGKYGTCWTCPPGAGTPEALRGSILSYLHACVFSCVHTLEDSFDFEGMIEAQQKTQSILRDIVARLRRDGQDVMAIGCEGCSRCSKCTYPDGPCRFPEYAVPSVEACGIHMVELAKRTGLRYYHGASTVTYFCLILF